MLALQQAEAGVPVEEFLRRYRIFRAAFRGWREKYGGLEASEMKRLRDLEAENERLESLVADLAVHLQIALVAFEKFSRCRA